MKWWDRCHDLSFLSWVLSQHFHSPLFPSSRGSLVPLCFLPVQWLLLLFSSVMSSSLQPRGLQSGFRVLHHLPEIAQSHVHWVSDSIQPSRPLSSSSPPTLNLSQHQGLFQRVGSSYQWLNIGASVSASVFLMNMQDWFPLGLTGLTTLQPKGLSRVFSNTPQFKSINSSAVQHSLWSSSHIHTWLLEKP